MFFSNNLLLGNIETTEDATGQPQIQKDEFLPKYELEYALPDIPIKPKLFRHVDSDPLSGANNLFKYEYSSIEMVQEQSGQTSQIYCDYNLGMKTNLVDRQVYKIAPNSKLAAMSKDELKA